MAAYNNEGKATWYGTGSTAPRPFLLPATQDQQEEARRAIERALKEYRKTGLRADVAWRVADDGLSYEVGWGADSADISLYGPPTDPTPSGATWTSLPMPSTGSTEHPLRDEFWPPFRRSFLKFFVLSFPCFFVGFYLAMVNR